jgi:hypothetical protein
MSKLFSILGKFQGSKGNLTFQNWKGLNTVRQKPVNVANPRTEAQQLNRTAFRQTSTLAAKLRPALALGFGNAGGRFTIFNWFHKKNRKNYQPNNWPDNETDFYDALELEISGGSVAPPESMDVQVVMDGESLNIQVDDATDGVSALASDIFVAVIITKTLDKVRTVVTNFTRAQMDAGQQISFGAEFATIDSAVHGFFVRADGSNASPNRSTSATIQ